jgi:hypothetical protein
MGWPETVVNWASRPEEGALEGGDFLSAVIYRAREAGAPGHGILTHAGLSMRGGKGSAKGGAAAGKVSHHFKLGHAGDGDTRWGAAWFYFSTIFPQGY